MKVLLNRFKKSFLPKLLFLITLYICYKNYVPGTFLTGWDTLHPEFNFGIYWARIINGAWQAHQGLGAVASQAHASEIPRIALLTLLNLVLRMDQIRYAYAFLMLILGPLGVYYLIRRFTRKFPETASSIGAFAGGLLYLLNLGTLQHFYVPLEMFLTHYGLLGFVILFGVKYLEEGGRKNLLWFSLITLFMSSQAHTATLFYAYFLVFGLFFLVLGIRSIKRVALLVLLTLSINSFWILPNVYFVLNHGDEIQQSKIHELFTTEAFLSNTRFGDIKDVAILRNFLFQWGEHVGNAQFGELLSEWISHLNSPLVTEFGYAFFIMVVLGLIISLINKQKYAFATLAVFLTSMFFLFTVNPPLGFLFKFLQDNIPLFREAFRFPFTKFSISLMLCYGIFFGYLFSYVALLIEKRINSKFPKYLLLFIVHLIIIIPLVAYMKPAFEGNLISPSMKVGIPQRYFDLFNYLNQKQEYGRVANFPIHSFWGWVYHNWDPANELGYQGAGFLWFGIKQPLLDREFDRWNILNEQYYEEMSYAVYSENPVLLQATLEKFKIRWILLDESILVPGGDQTQLFYKNIKTLLAGISSISMEKSFGLGLSLYTYKPEKDFSLTEEVGSFYKLGNSVFKEYTDPMYLEVGNYIQSDEVTYPYVGITTYNERISEANIESTADKVIFKGRVMPGAGLISGSNSGEIPLDIYVSYKNESIFFNLTNKSFSPEVNIEKALSLNKIPLGDLTIEIGDQIFSMSPTSLTSSSPTLLGQIFVNPSKSVPVSLYSVGKSAQTENYYFPILEPCSDLSANASYEVQNLSNGFKITARNVKACLTLGMNKILDPLLVKQGDLVELGYESGESPSSGAICVFNNKRGLCENLNLPNGTQYFILNGLLNDYNLRFYVDASNSDVQKSALFSNIQVSYTNKLTQTNWEISLPQNLSYTGPTKLEYPKIKGLYGTPSDLLSNPRPCNSELEGSEDYKIQSVGDGVGYESKGLAVCDTYWFPTVSHDIGYVLEVESKNTEGSPLRLCLTNEYSKRCDIYVELPSGGESKKSFYLIPPMGNGTGFSVNLSNLTFGDETSINELSYIALTPVPYSFVKSLHVNLEPLKVTDKKLLIYNQAYEKGWLALCGNKLCNAEHVMVNNWSNGWVFDSSFDTSGVKIVFWPQALEYLGAFLCLVSFTWVLIIRHKASADAPNS